MREQSCHSIHSLEDLRNFVYATLCTTHHLQSGAFQMTEKIVRRVGKPCGMYFCLHGPRAVKFTAIWETDKNTILFYGPTGERFCMVRLEDFSLT